MAQSLSIDLDPSDFLKHIDKLTPEILAASNKAEDLVADEVLRLSQHEVPKDKGYLEGTGVSDRDKQGAFVGYNTPYAARLHEHPEFNFKKGRKGKYLEDPIKENLPVLREYYIKRVKEAIR